MNVPVLPKSEFGALCGRVGKKAGKGSYEALVRFFDEHFGELDVTRNVQWELELQLNKDWFAQRQLGERWNEYIRDVIVSVVTHAASIATAAKRQTVLESDITLTLGFLDEIY